MAPIANDIWSEIATLQSDLTATTIEVHREEIWGYGLGGEDVRGGVGPESQYGWGPIVTGYTETEVLVPDIVRRNAAVQRLQEIRSSHADLEIRQLAARALNTLRTADNE